MLVNGKKALVTGGARGIGREIVLSFLSNGASVYFIDINESEHMAEYEALAKEKGVTVHYHKAKWKMKKRLHQYVKEILEECAGIDIL
jgi:3-oxoacyl-[acyl-carrier protein] reductase